MAPVEILHAQGTVVLRARTSELIIIPTHVKALKGLAKPEDFSSYFTNEALVNRAARKLFEAWLRKDKTVWPRLYKTIHKEIEMKDVEASEELMNQAINARKSSEHSTVASDSSAKETAEKVAEEAPAKKKTTKKVTKAAAEDGEKPAAKKTAAKKTASKKTTSKKSTEE